MSLLKLEESIAEFPALARTMGARWIREQSQMDPVDSAFALARWLRIPGFRDDLSRLNTILDLFWDVPGVAERRRRFQGDALAFHETWVELYAAHWFHLAGYPFSLPACGPDLSIALDGAGSLLVEVTSPRQLAWKQDVLERLDVLGLQRRCKFQLKYEGAPTPSDIASGRATQLIVEAGRHLISTEATDGICSGVIRISELDAELTASISSGLHFQRTTVSASRFGGAYFLAQEAMIRKADQFAIDQPNIVMVSIGQMADQDQSDFEVSLSTPASDVPIDWTIVPRNVRGLFLCHFTPKETTPFYWRYIENPNCTFDYPPGAVAALESMFAVAYSADEVRRDKISRRLR